MKYDLLETLNKDELYIEIGKSLHKSASIIGFSEKDYIKLGKDWFEKNINLVKEKLCSDQVYELLKDEDDKKKIALLIADSLSTIVTIIPIFTLAVLISKIGIKNICLEDSIKNIM